jgi:hypothetical protein
VSHILVMRQFFCKVAIFWTFSCYLDVLGHFMIFWFFDLFCHFRHVTKFWYVEIGNFSCYFDVFGHFMIFCFFDLISSLSTRRNLNGHIWCYFDVFSHFMTYCFFDLISSLSTRVEISTCRKWSFFMLFWRFKSFYDFLVFWPYIVTFDTCRNFDMSKMVIFHVILTF